LCKTVINWHGAQNEHLPPRLNFILGINVSIPAPVNFFRLLPAGHARIGGFGITQRILKVNDLWSQDRFRQTSPVRPPPKFAGLLFVLRAVLRIVSELHFGNAGLLRIPYP
jgi:hypothetical protein